MSNRTCKLWCKGCRQCKVSKVRERAVIENIFWVNKKLYILKHIAEGDIPREETRSDSADSQLFGPLLWMRFVEGSEGSIFIGLTKEAEAY